MYDLAPVLTAAEKRLDLINQLEQETNDLLLAPIERLAECLESRQVTLESFIEADKHLRALCSSGDLEAIIDFTCDLSDLTPELVPLFELSLSVRAGMNRILNTEPSISARFELERASILNKIEDLNAGATAAANKYYRAFNAEARQDTVKTI
ncbi:MAG: hypothetical protein GX250_04915 [Clostridiales bacterium]|jgi:hypothetical protein|nr:hypothetical protein [Clostridiales bacterium]